MFLFLDFVLKYGYIHRGETNILIDILKYILFQKILARARERQKMLEVYGSSDDNARSKINSLISLDSNQKHKRESISDPNLNSQTYLSSSLKENNSEGNLSRFSRQNSKTRVSSEMPGSPNTQLKTLNIQQDNFNMEIKVTSSENIRVEVEIGEREGSESPNSNLGSPKSDCGLRNESKKRLKQLGKLYGGKFHIYIYINFTIQ